MELDAIEAGMLHRGARPMRRLASPQTPRDFNATVGFANEPCVLTGMSGGWAALGKWTWDFLAELADVTVNVTEDGDTFVRTTVAEFVDMVKSGAAHKLYMKDATFHHCEMRATMSGDYQTPSCFANWLNDPDLAGKHCRLNRPHYPAWSWIYCGPRGSMSPLHVDVFESSAWNVLLSGAKLWIFFPPSVSESSLRDSSTGDYVNPFALSMDAQLMSRAVIALQQPGEVVFTPSGWYHAVLNVQNSIALTENFINGTNFLFVLRHLHKELEKERGKEMEAQIEAVIDSLTRIAAERIDGL